LKTWKQGVVGFIFKGAVICASFFLVFGVTYRLNRTYLRQAAETLVVVTAKTNLLPGTPLITENLSLAEIPAFSLGADYSADQAGLLADGPWYVGEIGFAAGEPLRPSRLTRASEAGGDWRWEFAQRKQGRLIAVETSLVRSSGNWLQPGSFVDAIVYLPAKERYDEPQPSQVIGPEEDPLLSGLLVIDKKSAGGLSLDGVQREEGYSRDLLPAVVTLMLDEEDTERIKALIRYNEEGRIYLSPTAGASKS